jgi:hypothetical protein
MFGRKGWWSLGEGSGHFGEKFSPHRIECPFCGADGGHYTPVFHQERRSSTWHKGLNFDVWQCSECSNYIFVIWSASSSGRVHDFVGYPGPRPKAVAHPSWPEPVGRAYVEAERALGTQSWNAAATMARRALQATTRSLGAKKGWLVNEIKELGPEGKGILPKALVDWATAVRELGAVGAHPDEDDHPVAKEDAEDVVRFTGYFLDFVYTIPHEIAEFQARRQPKEPPPA